MLIEDELYIYYDKENEKFRDMYVISGSYIKILPGKSLLNEEIAQILSKVYSIEVYVGGRVGSIMLHFDSREIQDEWSNELQIASGNLCLLEHYKIWDSFKLMDTKDSPNVAPIETNLDNPPSPLKNLFNLEDEKLENNKDTIQNTQNFKILKG